ncbi:hypothetical protein [Providencia rettgeri]|uniref:hypothetical protein n=1 Tax=Providencia rettgeri TaxID=587 RepID=UPI00236112FB|nr:hypothetical protein [Providencia rettgeri]
MINSKRINAMNLSISLDGFAKLEKELNKLLALIESQFPDYLNIKDEQIKAEIYGVSSKYYSEHADWFINQCEVSFTVLPQRNRTKGIGYVKFNIALSGESISQYDEGVKEPLLHIEFTIDEPCHGNSMTHPVKRSDYSKNTNDISIEVENNIVIVLSNTSCIGALYSVRLFDINADNMEELLFEPIRKVILKYVYSGIDVGNIYVDGDSLIFIPQPNEKTKEIDTYQNVSLIKSIDFIMNKKRFTYSELHDFLQESVKVVSDVIERMISAGILITISDKVFELKINDLNKIKQRLLNVN